MKPEGSCACGQVGFSLETRHPYPFNLCYCSICRKTAGGGGFAINLGGDADSLVVSGREHTACFQAPMVDQDSGQSAQSPAERHFCRHCGSALWVWDSRWPELLHPFASAIDTALPTPPERTHLMLDSKAEWVELARGAGDQCFAEYPTESIAEWHQRLGVEQ